MTTVAIIGAGHNGLVAAALLARRGMQVTVLEAGAAPGGCIWTRSLPSGHRLELGAIEHGGAVAIAEELGLSSYGLRFASRSVVAGARCGDETRLFHVDAERTAEALGADGPAYRELVALAGRLFALLDRFPVPPTSTELAAALAMMSGGDELFRLLLSSAEAVAERRITDPALRAALTMHAAHGQMPPWAPGTGMFSLLLPSEHGERPARPIGGSVAFVDALVAAVEAAGGAVQVDARVTRIAEHGAGARLELASGDAVTVDVVLSTLDVRRTLQLLDHPPAALVDAARNVSSGRLNVGEFKLDVALSAAPDAATLAGAADAMWMLQRTPTSLRRAFGDLIAGRLPDDLPVMVAFPSASDPSAAPDGAGVAWVSAFVPLVPDGGWTDELRERAVTRAMATVEELAGVDLAAGVVETVVSPPDVWADRLGSADGNPNHLDLSLDQLLGWRPPGVAGHRTSLPWLLLAGAGTHPGGGLHGASGRAAAVELLEGVGHRPARRAKLAAELASLLAGWRFYRQMRRGAAHG